MEVSRRTNGPTVITRNKSLKNLNAVNEGRKALTEVNSKNVLGAIQNKIQKPGNEIRKPVKAVRRLKPEPVKEKPLVETIKEETPVETKVETPVEKAEVAEKEIEVSDLVDGFSAQLLPNNVLDIDSDDALNPQLVSEYINDIYKYLWSLEAKYKIRKNHLDSQSEITGKMRSILVDWLVQVHLRFHLLQETLYLTLSILDRFLQVREIRRSKLQLVGVSAMFIASKYEEMYAPEVQDFVYITDNAYTKQEILRTEGVILRNLEFNLSKPLPLHFLRRNSKAGQIDMTTHALGKYLLEILVPEYDVAHYSPSLMAAAATYLSRKVLDSSALWSETMVFYSNHTENEIMPLVHKLCKILLKAEGSKLQAIRNKYASAKLLKISTISELKSDLVKKLASEAD